MPSELPDRTIDIDTFYRSGEYIVRLDNDVIALLNRLYWPDTEQVINLLLKTHLDQLKDDPDLRDRLLISIKQGVRDDFKKPN